MVNLIFGFSCFCYTELIKDLLLHPHAWIRLASAKLLGVYLSWYQPSEFLELNNEPDNYFYQDLHGKVNINLYTNHSEMSGKWFVF